MPAHSAPASMARTIAMIACGTPGSPAHTEPTHTDVIAPIVYWPWPPMLNMPQRNANATARPVRISGVVTSSVCCRLNSAVTRASPSTHGKNQFSPVPSKMPL